jgi:hypothetical protein
VTGRWGLSRQSKSNYPTLIHVHFRFHATTPRFNQAGFKHDGIIAQDRVKLALRTVLLLELFWFSRLPMARLLVLALLVAMIAVAHCAVLGIDFGSEWIKVCLRVVGGGELETDCVVLRHFDQVGLAKPGIPLAIINNEQSKRKDPAMVGFADGERVSGESALTAVPSFRVNCHQESENSLLCRYDRAHDDRMPFLRISSQCWVSRLDRTPSSVFKTWALLTSLLRVRLGMLDDGKSDAVL